MEADAALPREWQPLIDLLRRAEGVASSAIEDVRAPLAEVAMAEADPGIEGTARRIAANLDAVRAAVRSAAAEPLTLAAVNTWHRRLMRTAPHLAARHVGMVRDVQGWIGGTSPLDAALVTPPPDRLPGLLEDLVSYCNREDLDPIVQAAVAHAQFEIVHPYADGNGRIGRVLIGWVLARRLGLRSPPMVSVGIARDPGGYLSGLALFRLGQVDPWVTWMAQVVADAASASRRLVAAVAAQQQLWSDRLVGVRSEATSRRVLHLLPSAPVLSAVTVAAMLGVSERTGRSALSLLEARGVVHPYTPRAGARGRPRRWWVARELLALVPGGSQGAPTVADE